jgi:predicted acylesterase/phospholipase RssA
MLSACGALRPHHPPPGATEGKVAVAGMPGVRAWGDAFSPEFQKDMIESVAQEKAGGLFKDGDTVSILAISGGGGDGAFGAGLINGWTVSGKRPNFKLVTGVSTGALTAPFAFLGPAYDEKLKKVYTTLKSSDIFMLKSVLAMLKSDAIGLNDPLSKLTTEYVDEQMLKDIAAEHRKGRRLYIGTTALDAQRPVIWNMGAIAASGHPDAPELFRKVMIASAAVPAVFPPIYFKVDANGKTYDEMHVDGGVTNQVFMYGPVLDPLRMAKEMGVVERRRNFAVYVLRNTQLKPDWKKVTPTIRSIIPRAVSTLIKSQGVGDIYRIYTNAQRDNFDFNLAFIPDEMDTSDRADEFDNGVMNVLFDTGYKLARNGYRWRKGPPGFLPLEPTDGALKVVPASSPAR